MPACARSNFLNCFPADRIANRPSHLGIGCWSVFKTGFIVTIKSPEMRIETSAFGIGTIGVANSLVLTLSVMPWVSTKFLLSGFL